jgi:hypothetical protein
VYVISLDAYYSELLDESEQLHDERLASTFDLVLFRPMAVKSVEGAIAGCLLLNSLRVLTKKQLKRSRREGA